MSMIHWINVNDKDWWDSLVVGVVGPFPGPRLATTTGTRPSEISTNAKWCYVVNVGTKTPQALADAVTGALDDNVGIFVAINEISVSSGATVAAAANIIGPGRANQWGAYVVYRSAANGPNFPEHAAAIDAVFANNGRLFPQLYVRYSDYWINGNTDSERDAWMNATFFNGPGKFNWVVQRKCQAHPISQSLIHPVFSASDTLLVSADETKNARFLDRVFYVFASMSGYQPYIMWYNDGGPASYLWQQSGDWGEKFSNTRDYTFAVLWQRYVGTGATTPNWSGPMPSPI
jgi:hypothetical protein